MTDTRLSRGGVPRDNLAIVTADQSTVVGDGTSGNPLHADSEAITGVINVRDFGARGDGVTDDADAILRAVAVAATEVSSDVRGAYVYFPKGKYKSSRQIAQPDGVGIRGDTSSGLMIIASDDFDDESLLCNANQTGGQEFVYLSDITIDGNKAGGAVCSVAVVNYVSVFINSYVRDVVVLNGSAVGLRVAARNACGPVMIANTWVAHCGSHNVLLEEEVGNTGGMFGICANGLWSENCGPNASAIYLRGRDHAQQWNFWNIHIEMGTPDANRTGITIDGVPLVLLDGVQLLKGSTPLAAGILITDLAANFGIQIRSVDNPNIIDPLLVDLRNHITIHGPGNIATYMSDGVDFQGGPSFRPGAESTSVSLAIQDANGTRRLWFDPDGRLNGRSVFGGALEIVAEPDNNRTLMMLNQEKLDAWGFYFADTDNLRLRDFTSGADVFNFFTNGGVRVYRSMRGLGDRTTPPSFPDPEVGEVVLNGNPIAGGFLGWVFVEGAPNAWKAFGAIAPMIAYCLVTQAVELARRGRGYHPCPGQSGRD